MAGNRRAKRRQESCRPKAAMHAGMNGTSPEIPYTVDADPYATTGKAPATARSGQSGPASTGASAVGMQGREARGTREIPPSARPSGRGRRRKAIPSADVRVLGSRIGPYYRGSGVMPVEGRGRRTSVSSGDAWRARRGPHPCPHRPADSTLLGELVRRARCRKSARRVPWGGAGVTRRSTRQLY